MGKNHRHAKKLKSEKNKVHIKGTKTKFLPKGQNVTNTSFKVRPIVLHEQLGDKGGTSGLVGKKIHVEDAISRLRHYHDAIRVEACQDLRHFFAHEAPTAAQRHLPAVMRNASGLIQDRERRVRRACVKLLSAIFERVSVLALRAFSNFVLTNLKCAMTNINRNIQEDSLLLLDALLEHQGLLIAENFDSIFPNFLMLISHLKSKNSSERSLSLNLEGKVTSVKWRVKVLSRLYGILNAVVKTNDTKENDVTECSKYLTVYAKDTKFIPIYREIKIYENVDFSLMPIQEDSINFDTHILNLIQLLHEMWIEAIPEKSSKNYNISEPTILPNQESVAVFSCVIHILQLLQIYIQKSKRNEIFSHSKSTLFLDHLIKNFPYAHNKKNLQEIGKEFSRCFVLNSDRHCTEENLIIIDVYITERLNNVKSSNPNNKTIGAYLRNCLKLQSRFGPSLIKILKTLLTEKPNLSRKLSVNVAEVTENLANSYGGARIPDVHKNDILEMLTGSATPSWLERLPDLLLADRVPAKVVDTVLDLCREGHRTVQVGVRRSLKRILDNLPSLEICDAGDPRQARMNFVSIFFYLPDLSEGDLGEIGEFIRRHPGLVYSRYLRNVLELRSTMC